MSVGYQEKLELLEKICRQKSLRLTQQKRMVLKELVRRSDHPTADQLYLDLRKSLPDISRATVYRILEFFVQEKVIQRICHPKAVAHYDADTSPHHHLICRRCQRIMDLELGEESELACIPTKFPELSHFKIETCSIYFFGVCGDCSS
ncbi:MAG: transcriptional repressor [Planctomycetota bacterium]|nr:MAG: transcriptional repressor [Planctomycetota bacterium]